MVRKLILLILTNAIFILYSQDFTMNARYEMFDFTKPFICHAYYEAIEKKAFVDILVNDTIRDTIIYIFKKDAKGFHISEVTDQDTTMFYFNTKGLIKKIEKGKDWYSYSYKRNRVSIYDENGLKNTYFLNQGKIVREEYNDITCQYDYSDPNKMTKTYNNGLKEIRYTKGDTTILEDINLKGEKDFCRKLIKDQYGKTIKRLYYDGNLELIYYEKLTYKEDKIYKEVRYGKNGALISQKVYSYNDL